METVGLVLVLGLEQASATMSTKARVNLDQDKSRRTNFENVMTAIVEEEKGIKKWEGKWLIFLPYSRD